MQCPVSASFTTTTISDDQCDCYMTNGSDRAFFSYHQFFDFRSLSPYQGTPNLLPREKDTIGAQVTSGFFTSGDWDAFWDIQRWTNKDEQGQIKAPVLRVNSANNVFIETNTDQTQSTETWLTLRTARQDTFQSAAEVVSTSDAFQFVSMRMLARTTGDAGGCTAMFTYRQGNSKSDDKNASLQEVDLEVLTKYPRTHVQCTNQPPLDSAGQLMAAAETSTLNASLPDGFGWDAWNIYRLDWTPHQSTWYVGGHQIANISSYTPRDASRIHLNAWSDGSSWTGAMDRNGSARLQIQWWEILYNTSSGQPVPPLADAHDTASRTCRSVCSLDEPGSEPGKAVLIKPKNGIHASLW